MQGLCRAAEIKGKDATVSVRWPAGCFSWVKTKDASTPSEKECSHLKTYGLLILMPLKQRRSWAPQLFPEQVARK